MLVKEIVEAIHGVLLQGDENIRITSYSNDTRTLEQGALYIPIIGEVFDGHSFIEKAYENGAIATFTSKKEEYPTGMVVIYVEDTLRALQKLAHYRRMKNSIKVVAVTGSVGKTSTKDMIASVISMKYKTMKTLGNYNSDIGLPLTILRLQDEEVMVLEMGMNHLGEISLLSKIALPDVAVITNVGTAHIGNLGSRENILKAKLEIVDGLKDRGTLIINGDNDVLSTFYKEHKNKTPYTMLSFGLDNANHDFNATAIHLQQTKSNFTYKDIIFTIHVAGEHFIANALASIVVGEVLGIPLEDISTGISSFELTKNRNDIFTINKNIILIDGTYNANVDSMKASLNVLSSYEGKRKVAVLADMLELGEYTTSLHEEVGNYLVEKGIDVLICVGELSKSIQHGAKGMKEVYWFSNNLEASAFLLDTLRDNDVVLLKGSNSMNLNEIVLKLKEAM